MMLRRPYVQLLLSLLICLLAVLTLFVAGRVGARPQWQQKVDAALLDAGQDGRESEFLVVLAEQADLSMARQTTGKAQKGAVVYAALTDVAERTQAPMLAELARREADYRPYWISNMVWVRGEQDLLQALAERPEVKRIHANPWARLDSLDSALPVRHSAQEEGVEWNISKIGAPAVWAAGATGQGVVIGGQDTGYDWTHPALMQQYRGWDGQTAEHAYNWHDAIHADNPNTAPGNPCGYDSPAPCDDNGHGTHTMGTMVGRESPDDVIGVAPDAQWMACRNMEQGWGTPATYAECYEWFVAPYPPGGDPFADGDPAKAPHVINNSWSCPVNEGCTQPDVLKLVVEAVRSAGIVTVHSAANDGPSCGTVTEPAAIYEASFTVGATDVTDAIAGFSSRGPAPLGEGQMMKPDISAPGVGIRSSVPGGYGFKSGTSMAAPHVAGLVALLISAEPDLAGDVAALEALIELSAVALYSAEGCGGDTAESRPNNTFGWGRIDAWAAFERLPDNTAVRVFLPVWRTP